MSISPTTAHRPFIDRWHEKLLGESMDNRVAQIAWFVAIAGFVVHLLLWLVSSTVLEQDTQHSLLQSPLSALYTPFSILLAYEIYELIRAIPTSFSSAIGKQYEIVTLLVVRDIFKRLADIDSRPLTQVDQTIGLISAECGIFLLLFFTSLKYQQQVGKSTKVTISPKQIAEFVRAKQWVSLILFCAFIIVSLSSFGSWLIGLQQGDGEVGRTLFFLDFFTFLIVADIFVLLISHRYAVGFLTLARNTGFVLATVLLRLAIGTTDWVSVLLFLIGGLLGLLLLRVSRANEG